MPSPTNPFGGYYSKDPGTGRVNYPGSGQYSNEDYFRGQTFYNADDPGVAFDSSLRDYGVNPFAANPYTQFLRTASAPLASSYNANMATWGRPGSSYGSGAAGSNTYANPLDASTYPFQYAEYMSGAQQGKGMSQDRETLLGLPQTPVQPTQQDRGGIFTRLQDTRSLTPELIKAIREESANTSGSAPVNPFLGQMAARLGSGEGADVGMGLVNYLSQLNAPLMAKNLRDAYRNQLIQRQQNAVREFGNQTDPTQGDIWKYMGF